MIVPEREALADAVRRLSELLEAPAKTRVPRKGGAVDLEAHLADLRFALSYRATASVAAVTAAAEHLLAEAPRTFVPLIVAPYMGPDAREAVERRGVAWLDLSGNAHIKGPRLLVHVEGMENKYKRSGRPENVFAPKSARITRAMLHAHETWFSQTELAHTAQLSAMQVSRVVGRLESDELVIRNEARRVRPRQPSTLLETWRASYDFNRHRRIEAHRFARGGEELTLSVHEFLAGIDVRHAFTGLASAWLFKPIAAYRTSSVYVERMPSDEELKQGGIRREERGGNIWFVLPTDDDLLRDEYRWEVEGIPCVSQIQTWLDLHSHPERAKEAAVELLEHDMPWNRTR